MFRHSITLREAGSATAEMKRFQIALGRSGLQDHACVFLREQVEASIRQFGDQLMVRRVQGIRADRVFEGDGYHVSIAVRQGEKSLLSKIMCLFQR